MISNIVQLNQLNSLIKKFWLLRLKSIVKIYWLDFVKDLLLKLLNVVYHYYIFLFHNYLRIYWISYPKLDSQELFNLTNKIYILYIWYVYVYHKKKFFFLFVNDIKVYACLKINVIINNSFSLRCHCTIE